MRPAAPSMLDRRLLRQLWRLRGQVLAIAMVVAAGVALFITMQGALRSLEITRDAYYRQTRFAGVFAPVRRAPERLARRLAALDGVAALDTRLVGAIRVYPDPDRPGINGSVLSLPENRRARLNDIYLTAGRLIAPERAEEAVVSHDFARAHGLAPGDRLAVTLNGIRRTLRVVGLARAPEFIYAIPPGELVPDAARFAVLWMGRQALGAALERDGAFTEALIAPERGADLPALIDALDTLLAPYGAIGAYARADQVSNRFLTGEIDQLALSAGLLPTIFLGVAGFLLHVVTVRLVDREREAIGLLKAFGYRDRTIALYYIKLALVMVGLGALLGAGLGTWLGQGLAALYANYFSFPVLLFRPGPAPYGVAGLFAVSVAFFGAAAAVRSAVRLPPAEAMRPPAPPTFRPALPGPLRRRFDHLTRLIFRQLRRWPGRSAVTVLGIALAMGIRIAAQQGWDATDHMMRINYERANRQDLSLTFTDPQPRAVLFELRRLPGVLAVDPYRTVTATLTAGPRRERITLIGRAQDATLTRLLDRQDRALATPAIGLAVSRPIATKLGIVAGRQVRLQVREGRRPAVDLPVATVPGSYIGAPVRMGLAALDRLMGDGGRISGAHLRIDPRHIDALLAALDARANIVGYADHRAARAQLQKIMDDFLGTVTAVNTLFSSIIAIGVVYNAVRISLSERRRDLATLRVLGFTRAEVAYVLLGEIALATALALPLGAAIGWGLAWWITAKMSSDLFTLPLVIAPSTYGVAMLTVIGAAALSGLWAVREVGRLDLVGALKTRE